MAEANTNDVEVNLGSADSLRVSRVSQNLNPAEAEQLKKALDNKKEFGADELLQAFNKQQQAQAQSRVLMKVVTLLGFVTIVLLGGNLLTSYFAVQMSKETKVADGSLMNLDGEVVATKKTAVTVPDLLTVFTMSEDELKGVARVAFKDSSGNFHAVSVDECVKAKVTGTVMMTTSQGDTMHFGTKVLAGGQREKFMIYEKGDAQIMVPIGIIESSGRRLAGTMSPGDLECEGLKCPGDSPRQVLTSNNFALVCEWFGEPDSYCVDSLLLNGTLCSLCDFNKPTQAWVLDEAKHHLSSTVEGAGTFYLAGPPVAITMDEGSAGTVVLGDEGEFTLGGKSFSSGRRLSQSKTVVEKVEIFKPPVAKRRLSESCNFKDALQGFVDGKLTYGSYCGKGAPLRCASNGVKKGYGKSQKVCDDGGLDAACSKHDSGSYWQDLWGKATMSWCEVDRNFKSERLSAVLNGYHDGEISAEDALNGANCLFDQMPCLRYELNTYLSWCKKRWYSHPCMKTEMRIVQKWAFGDYLSGGCKDDCYKEGP